MQQLSNLNSLLLNCQLSQVFPEFHKLFIGIIYWPLPGCYVSLSVPSVQRIRVWYSPTHEAYLVHLVLKRLMISALEILGPGFTVIHYGCKWGLVWDSACIHLFSWCCGATYSKYLLFPTIYSLTQAIHCLQLRCLSFACRKGKGKYTIRKNLGRWTISKSLPSVTPMNISAGLMLFVFASNTEYWKITLGEMWHEERDVNIWKYDLLLSYFTIILQQLHLTL